MWFRIFTADIELNVGVVDTHVVILQNLWVLGYSYSIVFTHTVEKTCKHIELLFNFDAHLHQI